MTQMTVSNPTIYTDSKTAGWASEAGYRLGRGSGGDTRREARTVAWMKRTVRKAERRAAKRDLRAQMASA